MGIATQWKAAVALCGKTNASCEDPLDRLAMADDGLATVVGTSWHQLGLAAATSFTVRHAHLL